VNAELRDARALAISGVPYFLLDRRYAISGAQPAELFAQAIGQLRTEALVAGQRANMRD
jgi:predicted DsbA family dithiol-disulfide isomerase